MSITEYYISPESKIDVKALVRFLRTRRKRWIKFESLVKLICEDDEILVS